MVVTPDEAAEGFMKPLRCADSREVSLLRWQQHQDHFLGSQLEITCEQGDPEAVVEIDATDDPHRRSRTFVMTAMEVSYSSASASLVSPAEAWRLAQFIAAPHG